MMRFITDFADQGVILPVMATGFLVMALRGWWRGAVVWTGMACLVLAGMLLLKIAGLYYAWLAHVPIISPSGHVASACVVYGGLLLVLGQKWFARFPALMPVPVLGLALVIGLTRLSLHAHTLFEVVTGGIVGCTGGILTGRQCGAVPRLLWVYLLPCVGCIAWLFHGHHLAIEGTIRSLFGPEALLHD
ncbi:PA-phosphatase-like phosphoesterase [Gluconacetobacter sp. SXCC-1]|uniref:Phosphatase PAP2 family protein n=1 Tax=Komagataeibacter rhaeticus TaxID=215221 RepID=A0A181CCW8_9PROT|nr:phosphatase PAP2 family protein [Komagataeibacter rhaeticus]ATU71827.1 phosphatase PAP2 family protein [Komagataeibacter xylinus]EGG75812.1 PA-phosphatase-like phosphoesterase [Gluconacetobacter sp. SXCC-1]QIP36052.1 phosphatase PAP2 family protein [Komagataeibacter rhaeticus]QOC45812.1 phosphatase PAP2 family protein [Komagataeibacter rhaeticus]WPP21519.1 phosphatase PAP2 family protein [Komagataeibacter rhaeticus]